MHKIETDPNAKPIKMPFYRTTPKNHAEINRQVEDLLQNDIIQESNSEWHSPCLLVKKSSGEFRLVTDFRRLNKITKPLHSLDLNVFLILLVKVMLSISQVLIFIVLFFKLVCTLTLDTKRLSLLRMVYMNINVCLLD